jgi:VWFA-related protein
MATASGDGRKLVASASLTIKVATIICVFLGGLTFALSPEATAQLPSVAPTTSASLPTSQNTPEMTSHEAAATYKVSVRLVQLRVVVRDAHGKAIGTLHKENFNLFDAGKPQIITIFDVEKNGLREPRGPKTSQPANSTAITSGPLPELPERYIAYVFDDLHLACGDLTQVRNAADRHMGSLQPTDRVAIFSTAGLTTLDFTDDRTKLHNALLDLQSHASCTEWPLPTVLPFPGMPAGVPASVTLARQIAEYKSQLSLRSLGDAVRKISVMPGQRAVILVSPGFLATSAYSMEYESTNLIDRALQDQVTISALDARGLYTLGDITNPAPPSQDAAQEALARSDIMAVLADGTGGTFFQNSNDFDEAFRSVASAPEYAYVLGFSPQNLKLNGSFHSLKVTLNTSEKLTLQARRGYFAPSHADPAQQAKQEIEDALFSQEEMHGLPVDVNTQFFKPNDADAKLSVLAHIDVRPLHFRRADGRNHSNLTIVSGVFDRNGNFLIGTEKTLEMHLKDSTLANKLGSGLDVRSNFDVKPGKYLVRLVVRDEEGQIAAENSAVQIP